MVYYTNLLKGNTLLSEFVAIVVKSVVIYGEAGTFQLTSFLEHYEEGCYIINLNSEAPIHILVYVNNILINAEFFVLHAYNNFKEGCNFFIFYCFQARLI